MTGGPFRVSRNPIYLGMTLVLLAVVLFDGPAAALPVPLLFAFAIQKLYIEKEVAFLVGHFGDAYTAYRARVRRWL
jgi:protein-S-isoprenylcysteine O-methyltransferase Ste14